MISLRSAWTRQLQSIIAGLFRTCSFQQRKSIQAPSHHREQSLGSQSPFRMLCITNFFVTDRIAAADQIRSVLTPSNSYFLLSHYTPRVTYSTCHGIAVGVTTAFQIRTACHQRRNNKNSVASAIKAAHFWQLNSMQGEPLSSTGYLNGGGGGGQHNCWPDACNSHMFSKSLHVPYPC